MAALACGLPSVVGGRAIRPALIIEAMAYFGIIMLLSRSRALMGLLPELWRSHRRLLVGFFALLIYTLGNRMSRS